MRISDWSSDVCSSDLRYWQIQDAMKALQGARLTIAQRYLDGEIDRRTAVTLTQVYLLVSPARAERSVAFTDQYRSYVVTYVAGEAMELGRESCGERGGQYV